MYNNIINEYEEEMFIHKRRCGSGGLKRVTGGNNATHLHILVSHIEKIVLESQTHKETGYIGSGYFKSGLCRHCNRKTQISIPCRAQIFAYHGVLVRKLSFPP